MVTVLVLASVLTIVGDVGDVVVDMVGVRLGR